MTDSRDLLSGALAAVRREFDASQPFASSPHLIMACVSGSLAQNTRVSDSVAPSDIDIRGIVIPPKSFVLGLDKWDTFGCQTSVGDTTVEARFHSLDKFVRLALDGNPDAFEWMWLEPQMYIHSSAEWNALRAARGVFVSSAVGEKMGRMGRGQLGRMVKSGTVRHEQEHAFKTLEEAFIGYGISPQEVLDGSFVPSISTNMLPKFEGEVLKRLLDMFGKYRQIHSEKASHGARTFVSTSGMGSRRKAVVEAYDFDTKNACHMVRVLSMAAEFLESGVLRVYRTEDSEYLKSIKRGEVSLEGCLEDAKVLFERIDKASAETLLPKEPDSGAASRLMEDLYERFSAAYDKVLRPQPR